MVEEINGGKSGGRWNVSEKADQDPEMERRKAEMLQTFESMPEFAQWSREQKEQTAGRLVEQMLRSERKEPVAEVSPPRQQPPPREEPPSMERRPAFRITRVQQEDAATKAFAELDAMVGLDSVKKELNTLMARLRVDRKRRAQGLAVEPLSLHMVFTGPPGVGKTVVARVIGALYRSVGVLKKGHVIETGRSGLVGEYIGSTAPKTQARIHEAEGGILFIDEAYSLAGGAVQGDFGKEAIETLLKAMEDMRDRLAVIVAGYPAEMRKFIDSNPGLASRFTKTIDFPPYNAPELLEIFRRMLAKNDLELTGEVRRIEAELSGWFEAQLRDPRFGNARAVRTLVERVREAQAIRIDREDSEDLRGVTMADVCEALDGV